MGRFQCLRRIRCQCHVCIHPCNKTHRKKSHPTRRYSPGCRHRRALSECRRRRIAPRKRAPRCRTAPPRCSPWASPSSSAFSCRSCRRTGASCNSASPRQRRDQADTGWLANPEKCQNYANPEKCQQWASGCFRFKFEPHRICALDNIPAVGLPRLQSEELLVALVRAKCLRVVFQFVLAKHAWRVEIMHQHFF